MFFCFRLRSSSIHPHASAAATTSRGCTVSAFHTTFQPTVLSRLFLSSRTPSRRVLLVERGMSTDAQSQSHSSQQVLLTSTKSSTVKTIQALLYKRKRRIEMASTIVEGPRMIMDLLQNPKTRHLVQQVLVSSERNDFMQRLTALLREENQHPSSCSVRILQATPHVLNACSDTVTPQGIVAIVSIPDFEAVIKTQRQHPQPRHHHHPLYLVLDGVSDPGNVGTMLRSAVAVGAAGVLLLPHCCDVWNPKAIRSAMGCTFQIPIRTVESWNDETESLLQEWGCIDKDDEVTTRVYAATMMESTTSTSDSGDDGSSASSLSTFCSSVPYYDVDWTSRPSALVIGSEGRGLSPAIRSAIADGRIKAMHVPMEPGIESLNAAVCGSVVLFEYLRQCRTQP